jgi:polar amino acid transport system permease protein
MKPILDQSLLEKLHLSQPLVNWYQQPFVLLLFLAAMLVFGFSMLPKEMGVPDTLGSISIVMFLVFLYGLLFLLMSDRRKPEIIKNLFVVFWFVAQLWLFYQYSGASWALLRQQFFNFERMSAYWHILFTALLVTLKIGLGCFIIVPVIGLLMAIFRSFNNKVVNTFVIAYVDVFRSIPDIVLIVLVYFALPYIGLQFDSTTAVIIALTLLYSAYATEIFRSGIQSIQRIQIEASRALGFSVMQTMRLVILPQAIRIVIPPFTSLLVGILKSTAIASVAAAPELMTRGTQLSNQLYSNTPIVAVSIIYLVIILPLVILSNRLEKVMHKYKKATH